VARSLRGAAGVLLLGPALLVGAGLVGGTAAQVRAATVTEGWDPYGHGGMMVPLPGGGRVRLVLPSGAASPSAPAATEPAATEPVATEPATAQPTAPTTPGGPGGPTTPTAPGASDVPVPSASVVPSATDPAPDPAPDPVPDAAPPPPARGTGPGAGPTRTASASVSAPGSAAVPASVSARPSVALSDLPIPVLDPFYPGPAGPSASSASSVSSASPATSASAGSGDDVAGPSAGPVAGEPPDGWSWQPVGAGPPPLGPQALAGPLTGPAALPPLSGTSAGSRLARWEQRKRLLPLGVGLALIGAGAALFGWRLRRP
jgi:hypothetical protein